ncbi:hypothetical protein [Alkalihalobacillus sp. BA299]|uniref:hypothetical protein n=1 Tax=Alkalihalobacillus sp. BA299 TaxID=2815938 RepID=UPI001ADB2365|nr:hypothetical protein [Alkalihalobacillus sp. BA299]
MLKRKGVIAVGIFSVLFGAAWWTNGTIDRHLYLHELQEEEGIQLLQTDTTKVILHEPFKPREYIRIIK